MPREVTMTEAARVLGVSKAEVKRRLERGELKGRKKTASKFSDFLITLDDNAQKEVTAEVNAVLEAAKESQMKEAPATEQPPKPPAEEPAETATETPAEEPAEENEQEDANAEEADDNRRTPKPATDSKWWF